MVKQPKWWMSASLLALVALQPAASGYAQTVPPVPQPTVGDAAAQEVLDRTKDDILLQNLRSPDEKDEAEALNVDEAAETLGQGADAAPKGGLLSKLPSANNLQALRQRIDAQPNNLDHYFTYAQMAAQLGEWDKAIDVYQTMLQLMPALDRVRLDLGVAYMRIGQLVKAKGELETVMTRQPPEQVQNNIETILAQIDNELRTYEFSGSVVLGMHLDSNANSAPINDTLIVFNQPQVLSAAGRQKQDIQFFGAASLNHTYRPEWMKGEHIGAQWKSSAAIYQTEQSTLDNLDLQVFSFKTGPEFKSKQSGLKVSPMVGYNHIVLATHSYLRSSSAELKVEYPLSETVQLSGTAKHEWRRYDNAPGVTTYTDRDGTASEGKVGVQWVVTETDFLNVSATMRRERTRTQYNDNRQLGANVGFTHLFSDTVFANASAGYKNTVYDGPDSELISPRTRHDAERSYGLTFGVKLTDKTTATAGYQYRDVHSNLENYKYDNHRFSTAVSVKF